MGSTLTGLATSMLESISSSSSFQGLRGTERGFCLGLNSDRRPDAFNRCLLVICVDQNYEVVLVYNATEMQTFLSDGTDSAD
ncbi:hypothetical protein KCU92_g45, partial [Aureobasidium melanogenum]